MPPAPPPPTQRSLGDYGVYILSTAASVGAVAAAVLWLRRTSARGRFAEAEVGAEAPPAGALAGCEAHERDSDSDSDKVRVEAVLSFWFKGQGARAAGSSDEDAGLRQTYKSLWFASGAAQKAADDMARGRGVTRAKGGGGVDRRLQYACAVYEVLAAVQVPQCKTAEQHGG